MTDDIHAIIAVAKRTSHRDSHSMDKLLCDHAIAMAEALARIAYQTLDLNPAVPWEYPRDIARDCLDKIVKEANRG